MASSFTPINLGMIKHCVNWKLVTCKNVDGDDYHAEFPFYIDRKYRGGLLARILAMPKKRSIQFDEAIRMAEKNFFSSKIGHRRGETFWYMQNFVEWISELGFHIELTGDEFELPSAPQKAS